MAKRNYKPQIQKDVEELIARWKAARDAMEARHNACPMPGKEAEELIEILIMSQYINELEATINADTKGESVENS